MRCIPPGIQQMLAHRAHNHQQPIHNITPDMGDLIPPKPPQPPASRPPVYTATPRTTPPVAREPRAELARMAAAPAARGSSAEPARMAQEPRGQPARGAVGALRSAETRNNLVREGSAIPDPLGGEAILLVMEVYGWLSWATSGTTRGLSNWPFDAVLLWRDGGN